MSSAVQDGVTVVDGPSLRWVNGQEVYDSMEPAFRDNLGDAERVVDLLSRYQMRSLWLDPSSSRRIDHVQADPGYVDLSEAYHDSVEEGYFLGGECSLTAEGRFVAGDYFWRPPGWVHSASAPLGFEVLLMMEGVDASEGSGRVSRVVRPDDEAGTHALPGLQDALGPRGYERRAEARYMVWRLHDDRTTRLLHDGAPALRSKVLSRNVTTDAASVLCELPDGWAARPPAVDRERFLVNTSGALRVDGADLGPCSLIRIAPGVPGPDLESPEGTELFVKVGAPV
jgi:hypothetical protein